MLFEKLIEQHCIHGFIANAVWFALLVPLDQCRVHLFHLFGNEAKLRDTFAVDFLLVTKGNWLQSKHRFASSTHRLDIFLKPSRGGGGAEMTTGINAHCGT